MSHRASDPFEFHAWRRQPFSLPSATAESNLRETARYAWEDCGPLQHGVKIPPGVLYDGACTGGGNRAPDKRIAELEAEVALLPEVLKGPE